MPYIKQVNRSHIDHEIEMLAEKLKDLGDRGSLNYAITCLCHYYIKDHGLSYGTTSDVKGVLGDVYDEFCRRVQFPYEDKKIEENGDIGILEDNP